MSTAALEHTLRNLSRVGTLLKDREYRQVWRFEHAGKGYYLKFYPRQGTWWKRLFRGNPAWREFTRLQMLQKAKVPSPRAVAHLTGFVLDGEKGDAVILDALEPSVQLDRYLYDLQLEGKPVPNRRELRAKLIELLRRLGSAGLNHSDLHLGNFLLKDGEVYLLDGYAVHRGGLTKKNLTVLGNSVDRFATRTELLRGWLTLGGDKLPRANNRLRRRVFRKLLKNTVTENRYFGKLHIGDWTGMFFRHAKFPQRWAPASKLHVTRQDWEREWPLLLARVEADQLEIIKRSRSGDVLMGEVVLQGHPVTVIVKRPRRRYLHRYLNEIGRGARARRAWRKGWSLIIRDIPTAWPMLLMERRVLGYVVDTMIVFEKANGQTLSDLDLDALSPSERQTLMRRLGATLRRMESLGLVQYDPKYTNWIVLRDRANGPVPVVVDVDGIRRWTYPLWPIRRLLRSMQDHPQYTPQDSRELCLGYAPHAHLAPQDNSVRAQT